MGLECKDICVQLLITSKWMACICTLSDKMIVGCTNYVPVDIVMCELWHDCYTTASARGPHIPLDVLIPNINSELSRVKLSLWKGIEPVVRESALTC